MTAFTRVTDDVDDVLAAQHNELIDGLQQLPGPNGWLLNGRISVKVGSNNLTVELKTRADADPSATDPVAVRIGDTVRVVTAGLYITCNAGTNWCNAGGAELATKEVDYFVYLGYNATDGVVLGFSRIPYARLYSDFSTTNTNEKYAAISTITNAAAGDNYVLVGRFAATLSAGAGYTWTVPTFTAANLIQRAIYETRYLDYAPTRANITVGDGTATDKYQVVGRNLSFANLFTLGSTSSVTGTVTFSLPFTPAVIANHVVGLALLKDTGTAQYVGQVYYTGGATVAPMALVASATYASQASVAATVPHTWAATDVISQYGTVPI